MWCEQFKNVIVTKGAMIKVVKKCSMWDWVERDKEPYKFIIVTTQRTHLPFTFYLDCLFSGYEVSIKAFQTGNTN